MRTFIDVLQHRAARSPDATAFTFLADGEEPAQTITYGELRTRARAIAVELSRWLEPGDRAVLLYPTGISFIEAYLGCLYAGVIAVPLLPPMPSRLEKSGARLGEVFRSANPRAILASSTLRHLEAMVALIPQGQLLRWMHTDSVESRLGSLWRPPRNLDGDSVAFLQYTSGSTGTPRGVMVTHRNLLANIEMIRTAFELDEQDVFCHWLPMYHDMGLIGHTLAPMAIGAPVTFMDPMDFLQRPVRWLNAMTRFGGTIAASPNFGYELCARRVSAADREELDLSTWTRALNGAEPVAATTLRRFSDTFAGAGFRERSFRPCYGLAEATLLVAGTVHDPSPVTLPFDPDALSNHRAVEVGRSDVKVATLVASGTVAVPGEVRIVDPSTGQPCGPEQVGEIWLRGDHVARGYWRNDTETEATFGARLADGTGPFLRTGDLGVRRGEHLVVTGRLKDLIIQRGTNHYPQDLERTAEEIPGVRPAGTAAFGLNVDDTMEERVVLVVEVDQKARPVELALGVLMTRVREELSAQHGVSAWDVCVVPAGAIPRTSSGKIRRREARALYLADGLGTMASLQPRP